MGEPAEAVPAWEYAADVHRFVGADGAQRLGPLARYWGEPFEHAQPARKFAACKGQKNFTGDYWAVTSRSLVGYESWVERDAAMALDFDPAVVALASQPFRWSGRMVTGNASTPRTTSRGWPTGPVWSSMSAPRAWWTRRPPTSSRSP